MIQGSNAPIILNIDGQEMNKIYARLFARKRTVKEWSENDVTKTDDKLILPLTEIDTINIPTGTARLELKWTNGANVKFSKLIDIDVESRQDKRTFNVGEGDEEIITADVTPDGNQEVIIVKQYVGGSSNNAVWLPNVSADGTLTWTKSASDTAPTAQNIKGPKGDTGTKGDAGTTDYNNLENKPTILTQAQIQTMIDNKFDSIVDGDEVSY